MVGGITLDGRHFCQCLPSTLRYAIDTTITIPYIKLLGRLSLARIGDRRRADRPTGSSLSDDSIPSTPDGSEFIKGGGLLNTQ